MIRDRYSRGAKVGRVNGRISGSFLAEISVSSPQKQIILIISKNVYWIKVSKKRYI